MQDGLTDRSGGDSARIGGMPEGLGGRKTEPAAGWGLARRRQPREALDRPPSPHAVAPL